MNMIFLGLFKDGLLNCGRVDLNLDFEINIFGLFFNDKFET